jgi:predicted DNA-binding WGR domain protein
MRRFEYRKDTSSKFWEVEVSGSVLTTRWGRIGTTGQRKSKPFDRSESAERAMVKLVAEKLKAGYSEVVHSPDSRGMTSSAPVSRQPSQTGGGYRLVHRNKREVALLSVKEVRYESEIPPAASRSFDLPSHGAALEAMNQDLLKLLGLGWELLEVRTDAEENEAERAASDNEVAQVDEEVSASTSRDGDTVTVDAAERDVTEEQATAQLRTQLDKTCKALIISDCQPYQEPWYQTVAPWCAALGKLGSNTLERLVIDTPHQPLTRQASVYCGDITGLFQRCPRLRVVHVIGYSTLTVLEHSKLEDLTLMGDPLEPSTLHAILHGAAPRLRRLALGLSYEAGAAPGADEALLEGLLELRLPKLQELHLAYPENGAALLDALATSRLLEQVRVLSIEGAVFEDEELGIALLEKHRATLSKLSGLYLPTEDMMSRTDEELAKLIPPLRGIDELKELKVFDSARVLQ